MYGHYNECFKTPGLAIKRRNIKRGKKVKLLEKYRNPNYINIRDHKII